MNQSRLLPLSFAPQPYKRFEPGPITETGESWLFTSSMPNYCLGTGMCYWRRTWEEHPFADTNHGCDDRHWMMQGVKMAAVSSIPPMTDPRMIASTHSQNTCAAIDPQSAEWRRVPEFDAYMAWERMTL